MMYLKVWGRVWWLNINIIANCWIRDICGEYARDLQFFAPWVDRLRRRSNEHVESQRWDRIIETCRDWRGEIPHNRSAICFSPCILDVVNADKIRSMNLVFFWELRRRKRQKRLDDQPPDEQFPQLHTCHRLQSEFNARVFRSAGPRLPAYSTEFYTLPPMRRTSVYGLSVAPIVHRYCIKMFSLFKSIQLLSSREIHSSTTLSATEIRRLMLQSKLWSRVYIAKKRILKQSLVRLSCSDYIYLNILYQSTVRRQSLGSIQGRPGTAYMVRGISAPWARPFNAAKVLSFRLGWPFVHAGTDGWPLIVEKTRLTITKSVLLQLA